MIFLDKNMDSREGIIDFLLCEAQKIDLISEMNDIKKAIIARENQVSTAVGFHVAIPHGKSRAVNQPFVGFLRTQKPFKWTSKDKEDVQLILLIAIPEKSSSNIHLKIISNMSKKLLDNDFRNKLLRETSVDEIYKNLMSIKTF